MTPKQIARLIAGYESKGFEVITPVEIKESEPVETKPRKPLIFLCQRCSTNIGGRSHCQNCGMRCYPEELSYQ